MDWGLLKEIIKTGFAIIIIILLECIDDIFWRIIILLNINLKKYIFVLINLRIVFLYGK